MTDALVHMVLIVWEFHVKPESVAAFERYYGGEGDWAKLFARAEGYGGTQLLRDPTTRLRFSTVDHWETARHFERFKVRFAEEYAALDRECEQFTSAERFIGLFEVVGKVV